MIQEGEVWVLKKVDRGINGQDWRKGQLMGGIRHFLIRRETHEEGSGQCQK